MVSKSITQVQQYHNSPSKSNLHQLNGIIYLYIYSDLPERGALLLHNLIQFLNAGFFFLHFQSKVDILQ